MIPQLVAAREVDRFEELGISANGNAVVRLAVREFDERSPIANR
jgi:hypothetical protein